MLVEGVIAYLAADAGMREQLGTPDTRGDHSTGIFPILAPDSVPMPYVTCQQVSGQPMTTSFDGSNALTSERWRFSCYGISYKSAKVLARKLKLALLGLSGALDAGNVFVQGAWMQMEADDSEPIPHGMMYATHVDFEFNFVDAVA